jgi:hypothetical protein
VQLTRSALEDYLADVTELLERYGVVLDLGPNDDLALDESPSGSLSFELRGFLPDGREPPRSVLELREVWRPTAAEGLERWEYEFELLDHERDFRRAFHLHDRDAFVRRYQVVVHEHCEQPVGMAPCPHLAAKPVRDAFRGVELLVDAWMDPDIPDCSQLPCLEDGGWR